MEGCPRLLLLMVAVGLFGLSGAHCPQRLQPYTDSLPRALPPSPTLEQVIDVVNRNNSQIRSFWTSQARLSTPGSPTLRATVAFERPLHFRLRADTALTGPELDLGSNDELFWFWVKRAQPPAVFYCRHDQFPNSLVRQRLPIDPYWMIEALGTAAFDRALPHQGPFAVSGAGDRLEIRTIRDTPEGAAIKSTIVDAVRGYVIEQHIYDAHGRLLTSSVAQGHRRDPATGLIMPTAVVIECPPAAFSVTVDLGRVQINRLPDQAAGLWAMPNQLGAPWINLCSPSVAAPASVSSAPVASSLSWEVQPLPQRWPRQTLR